MNQYEFIHQGGYHIKRRFVFGMGTMWDAIRKGKIEYTSYSPAEAAACAAEQLTRESGAFPEAAWFAAQGIVFEHKHSWLG